MTNREAKKVMLILTHMFEDEEIKEALTMAIEALQTDVVRCKDCKHWYNDADTGMACEFTNMGQPEDGFCNWGERKNDGQ